jgi:hypothetical protein
MRWHEVHCQGLLDGLFAEDEARCRSELAQASAALQADRALSDDERRALEYLLLNFDYLIVNRFYEDAEQARAFAKTYPALCALPPAGPLSDRVQAIMVIGMLGMGVRRGFITMSEAEVDALVARVPPEFMTPNIWYYIVVWAYVTSNLKYLEQAFARQTVETTGWVDDYYWQRTNLMYLLVSRRATKLDVRKTLLGYRHPQHIQDFAAIFQPRCEAMGLMDDELRALHVERVAELNKLAGTWPAGNPKTVHVVKPVVS